jgi:hypothetical protein
LFENIGDLTVNLNKVLVANWFYDRLRIKFQSGYSIEVTGGLALELWHELKAHYSLLSEKTALNTSAIIFVKWANDFLQAEVKLDSNTIEYFYDSEAQELRRILRATRSESR